MWLRKDMPLKFFKGIATDGVFWNGLSIEKGKVFDDSASLTELIYQLAKDSTEDEEFSRELVNELAKRFGIENLKRDVPLDCASCKKCPEKLTCPRIGKV